MLLNRIIRKIVYFENVPAIFFLLLSNLNSFCEIW